MATNTAQYGSGSALCGYTVKYYYYSYPYFYTKMNHTYLSYLLYSYPVYTPNPVYQVSVTSNPAGLQVVGGGQYCKNQVAQVAVPSTVIGAGTGTRYVFLGWSGDYSGSSAVGQLTVSGSMNVVANFKTQYLLTVNSENGHASGSGWYDAGISAYATLDATVVDGATGSRVEFKGWTGDSTGQNLPTIIPMSGPKTVIASWKPQYYLSVSSPFGQASGSGWYDAGSTAAISVNTPIAAGYGSQYVFDRWIGTEVFSGSSTQVVVDKPITLEAIWRLDRTVLYETVGGAIAAMVLIVIAATGLLYRRRNAKVGK